MKGKPTKWTEQDIAYLIEHFPNTWNKDLAKHFNLGWRTIVRKARELKLEKAPDFRDGIDFTSFMKGVSPSNKGQKAVDYMSKEGFEASKKTRFKKGHVPAIVNDPKIVEKIVAKRNKTIRAEKIRIILGHTQKTKLKLTNLTPKKHDK